MLDYAIRPIFLPRCIHQIPEFDDMYFRGGDFAEVCLSRFLRDLLVPNNPTKSSIVRVEPTRCLSFVGYSVEQNMLKILLFAALRHWLRTITGMRANV